MQFHPGHLLDLAGRDVRRLGGTGVDDPVQDIPVGTGKIGEQIVDDVAQFSFGDGHRPSLARAGRAASPLMDGCAGRAMVGR